MAEERQLTYGQKAVGITFNPGNNSDVNKIKQAYADLIDFHYEAIHKLQGSDSNADVEGDIGEAVRLHRIAITDLQKVQMMSVKAITWPVPSRASARNGGSASQPLGGSGPVGS